MKVCWKRLPDSDEILATFGFGARTQSAGKMRRQIRRDWRSADGQVFFKMRSLTRDDDTRWHPVVDTGDGRVFCDCPDFHYRHARFRPDVWMPQHWCKHVERAVDNCVKHGDLIAA